MAWNLQKSRSRIKTTADAIPAITISDLTRSMNLENVTLAAPKRITGVHLYVAVSDEQRLLDDVLDAADKDAAKAPVRRAHLCQRELNRIVNSDFDAASIHFQGLRQHSLTYRPCGDQVEVAGRAVTMACAIGHTVRDAFNIAFPDDVGLTVTAGASHGPVIATKSGSRGDAELLFLGDAANRGAKVIDPSRALRLSAELVDLLDDDLGVELAKDADGAYRAAMTIEAVEAAVARYKLGWSLEQSRKRIESDCASITLDSIGISKATAEIDKGRLSSSNTKLNDAITAFGDLDGFTAIVEAAQTDAEQVALVRNFHIVRSELRHVAVQDYSPTLRVQYQGDRIQVLRHLPHDDAAKRALQAVRVAAGWQSSMRETLPEFITIEGLGLATGLAEGPTIVSRLGTRGNRDVIALGPGVRHAERIQRNLDADEVGIDGNILAELPEDLAAKFTWRAGAQGHVADDLRVDDLELTLEAKAFDDGATHKVTNHGGKIAIGVGAGAAALAVLAARSNAQEQHAAAGRRWAR